MAADFNVRDAHAQVLLGTYVVITATLRKLIGLGKLCRSNSRLLGGQADGALTFCTVTVTAGDHPNWVMT